jgi:FdhD protein
MAGVQAQAAGRPAAAGHRPLPDASRQMRVRRTRVDGSHEDALWGIAAETPVEININGRPLAVMMATPADVEDLALGFALSETILRSPAAARGFDVQVLPEGVVVDLAADPAQVEESRIRPRFLEGVSGCGLCGVERLADAIREVHAIESAPAQIEAEAILRAFDALPGAQALNRATRSVHAAAWASPDGAIRLVREDVGRHNALDKLIGARARAGTAGEPGFVVMSSRCSFELVQKCAVAGVGMLATVSAPTGLALALAQASGVRVASLDRDALIEFL